MIRSEIEDLLWELARLEEGERRTEEDAQTPASEMPDAVLEAYRAGALSAEEMSRVDRYLSRSTAGRETLAKLAGVSPPPMSDAARRRFLRTLARPARTQPVPRHWMPASPNRLLAAAAVLLVVGAGAAWLLLFPGAPEELPPLPEIQASIRGLAEVRGQPRVSGSDFTTAEADTAVTVGVALDPPRAGLEVGLYLFRADRGAVVRLPLQADWEDRRTAVFRAPARQLVGDSVGTYELFAVIGRADGLPPDRIVRPGEGPEVAFAGYDVKVEPLRLELVHGAAAAMERGSPDREATDP